MATSPSRPAGRAVVIQPPPSPEEVAAVMAAIDVVLGTQPQPEPLAPVWRWSGRRWQWPGSDSRRGTGAESAYRRG